MNTPGLRAVIQQLKETNLKENAYLGFFYNDNDHDYETYHIKANKEGLELYAAKFLEASLEMDRRTFINNEKEIFSLNSKWFDDSDFQFSHIELLQKIKAEIVEPIEEAYNQPWKDKLSGYAIAGCFIFVLFSILIGIITMITWLF
ncbi:hypothetical protein [Flavivirga algicola]|uniref:Uncharacterized protein n=1 Tax=Flavivirga algicola TaxID=2729136 RepID=A0ABX1S0S9_9FLAO|nr:hypothetical protein [Flavivirga algicola]NMH88956.1 hypothetical protein [Flavivirga algicola]